MGPFWLIAWVMAMLLQPQAQPLELGPNAIRQIAALQAEKEARTPVQQKLASSFLAAARMRRGEPVAQGVPTLRVDLDIDRAGAVLVDIRADVTAGLLQRIEASGGTVVDRFDAYRSVRARVPLEALESLAELAEVGFIRPADVATTNRRLSTGSGQAGTNKVNTSQGDVAHRAALARSTFGCDGTGIGIGVLSDGVNTLAARQASGDLPATVTVLPGQAGSGDEGTAMLEIVHDLAPGATLYFATGFSGQASFAANIQALCSAGANIVVDDVFYYAEGVFQDGIVANGVIAAMASGCHYFSSAGNSGNLNDGTSGVWEGDFAAAASSPPAVGGTVLDFGGTNSDRLTVDPPSLITLQWSDALGASGNDYDLYLLDSTLTTVLDSSTTTQSGTQDPYEFVSSNGYNDLNARLVILKQASAASRYLHLNTNRGRLEYATVGQVSGHAAVDGAFAVAAVDVARAGGGAFTGGASNPVETFSSDGPRRVFYQSNGTAITPGNFGSSGGALRQKPDITAADGVATSTPRFNPFYGTSAAAPHAAAIAALVLDAAGTASSLTAAQLRGHLTATALDIEASGVDRDSGAGLLDAYAAVNHVGRAFTDDPIVVGVTAVKAVHITELRARIDAVRVARGLGAYPWSETLAAHATAIRAPQITELRTALDQAYAAVGRTAPTYTDPLLTAGMAVRAVHVSELRAAVIAFE